MFCCSILLFFVNPDILSFQLACPVIYSAANMISMSCKSQAEVFARSLQTKLKVLDAKNSSHNSDSYEDCATSDDGKLSLANRFNATHYFPAPGTTFPPVRCAQFDLLRQKYHSESDLTPANLALVKRSMEDEFQDLFDPISKDMDDENSETERDSDLFFDFDIGSPAEGDADGEQKRKRRESLDTLKNGVLNFQPCDFEGKSHDVVRSCSPSNSNSPDNLATSSRFFGSVSSGLCSDLDTLQSRQEPNDEIEDEDGLCMSIAPQDWAQLHQ